MTSMAEHRPDLDQNAPSREHAASRLLEYGMMYATGHEVPADLVAAHMWFNLAAMRGSKEAGRLRREIAAEMSPGEIAAAQRAARDWLRLN